MSQPLAPLLGVEPCASLLCGQPTTGMRSLATMMERPWVFELRPGIDVAVDMSDSNYAVFTTRNAGFLAVVVLRSWIRPDSEEEPEDAE